jgi:hypothetical protein
MAEYNMNRGINKTWEVQGFVGKNVLYLAGGIIGTFFAFIVLFLIGVPVLFNVLFAIVAICSVWFGIGHINSKYGEHGLMKMSARRAAPKLITNRNSQLFLNLNENQTGRN